MRRSLLTVMFVAAAGVLSACQPTEAPKPNAAPNSSTPAPAATTAPAGSPSGSPNASPTAGLNTPPSKAAALEGVWPGASGSSLTITRSGDKVKVDIKGSDGKSATFDGTERNNTIEFKRNDKLETIRPATADETGLKWPEGEKNCVLITKGTEAYCRK